MPGDRGVLTENIHERSRSRSVGWQQSGLETEGRSLEIYMKGQDQCDSRN